MTSADFDAVIDLNLRSAFFVAQAVARKMIDAKRPGAIVQISSQMGHVGGARRTVYCASKHAIEGLTKAMAIDLAPHGIRVNSICPTFIETPMTRPFLESPEFRSQVLSKIKLGRIGQVEDIMGAVVLLASDASSLMTGLSLGDRRRVDRGMRSLSAIQLDRRPNGCYKGGTLPAELRSTNVRHSLSIAWETNVLTKGHVTGGAHREFAMASGEMSDAEFLAFNLAWMEAALPFLGDGGVIGTVLLGPARRVASPYTAKPVLLSRVAPHNRSLQ